MFSRSGYVRLPDGWERTEAEGPWPFVTRERFRGPDGREVRWESRPHRKARETRSPWWQPGRREWWMALLFAVGALCFTIGGIASQWSIGLAARDVLIVFFVGSIFFTSAAYLQFSEAVNAERGLPDPHRRPAWRPASWEPKRIDWWSTVIQLIGTVLFNVSTGLALGRHLTVGQTDLRVWAPDIFGSVAFLVSSQLAFAEVCHRWFCFRRRTLPWKVVAVNLGGSIAFGVSAIASLVVPGVDQPVSATVSDAGTYVGGMLFLLGAVLLVPETLGHRAARRRETERGQPAVRPAVGGEVAL